MNKHHQPEGTLLSARSSTSFPIPWLVCHSTTLPSLVVENPYASCCFHSIITIPPRVCVLRPAFSLIATLPSCPSRQNDTFLRLGILCLIKCPTHARRLFFMAAVCKVTFPSPPSRHPQERTTRSFEVPNAGWVVPRSSEKVITKNVVYFMSIVRFVYIDGVVAEAAALFRVENSNGNT